MLKGRLAYCSHSIAYVAPGGTLIDARQGSGQINMYMFIHLDESGAFDEGLNDSRASVVGGTCSALSSDDWDKEHRDHLDLFNTSQSALATFAYPRHYHCGELLANKLGTPPAVTRKDKEAFVDSVFQYVLRKSLFGFVSKNSRKRFEYSPQATYVMNLVAALRFCLDRLAALPEHSVSGISIVVAQRTIRETAQGISVSAYMAALLEFVTDQLAVGSGPGVDLAKELLRRNALSLSSGVATRDAGLVAADFVCCLARYNRKVETGAQLLLCHPNEKLLLGDYRNYYENQVLQLLDNGYYGTALEFICRFFPFRDGVPDFKAVMTRLEKEQRAAILERELPSLLAAIHSLAKQRFELPGALAGAIHAAECLIAVGERQLAKSSRKRTWLNLVINALAELAACHNHTGAIGPQQAAEERLISLIEANKRDTGLDAVQRRSLLLDIRNCNLNLLFNDFRFEEAYNLADELVRERQEMTGGEEPDAVLGKILGSMGQAAAFMAHRDPDWSSEAVELFKGSSKHFPTGSVQEEMSVNFLVTALWQQGAYHEAVGLLPPLAGAAPKGECSALLIRLGSPGLESRAFEVVNVLRLIAVLAQSPEALQSPQVWSLLEQTALAVGTDHPYEQWWKWLGIIHAMAGDFDSADRCLTRCETLCASHGFTMQVIGNSATLLRANLAATRGEAAQAQKLAQHFSAVLSALCQSLGFSRYIGLGTIADLVAKAHTARPGDMEFRQLCTYLPFTYA